MDDGWANTRWLGVATDWRRLPPLPGPLRRRLRAKYTPREPWCLYHTAVLCLTLCKCSCTAWYLQGYTRWYKQVMSVEHKCLFYSHYQLTLSFISSTGEFVRRQLDPSGRQTLSPPHYCGKWHSSLFFERPPGASCNHTSTVISELYFPFPLIGVLITF